jgi:hypothetical protein
MTFFEDQTHNKFNHYAELYIPGFSTMTHNQLLEAFINWLGKESLPVMFTEGELLKAIEKRSDVLIGAPEIVKHADNKSRNDPAKPQLSYVSTEMMSAIAFVRDWAFKNKYPVKNGWKKGFPITESLDKVLRHIRAYLDGETNDPESGFNHLYHAACDLEHAIYDVKHHPENDDRG